MAYFRPVAEGARFLAVEVCRYSLEAGCMCSPAEECTMVPYRLIRMTDTQNRSNTDRTGMKLTGSAFCNNLPCYPTFLQRLRTPPAVHLSYWLAYLSEMSPRTRNRSSTGLMNMSSLKKNMRTHHLHIAPMDKTMSA